MIKSKLLLFLSVGLQIVSVTVLFLEFKSRYTLRGVHSEFILYTITLVVSFLTVISIGNRHNFKKLNNLILFSLFLCFILILAIPGSLIGEGCITEYTSPSGVHSITIKERCGLLGCYPLHIYTNHLFWGYEIGQIGTSGQSSCALRDKTKVTWKNDESQVQWTVEEISGVVNIN